MGIIDLSLTIDNDCATCGTPWHQKVKIERMGMIEKVGRNTSRFVLGSHSATHMDAPLHFFAGTHGIDMNNIETCIGPVVCVDFTNKRKGSFVGIDDVKKIKIATRMLFVFGWYKNWKKPEYYDGFPYFSTDAVQFLVDSGMKLMALDTPSPDMGGAITQKDDSPNHRILLSNDVIIVEYLANTEKIDYSKHYEIMALPLKIKDADGAPSRVVLREVEG